MEKNMFRSLSLFLSLAMAATCVAAAQESKDGQLDVRSSVGDLHVGPDADARKVGLPLYPGARLKSEENNKNQANLSILTEAFGMKLVVANYVSGDDPAKVIDFYRDKLKRYGKVLECHTQKHGGNVDINEGDKDSKDSKELKCNENSGPVVELKAGTENNQHVVAVEPAETGKGSTFALVYVRTRGKIGEI